MNEGRLPRKGATPGHPARGPDGVPRGFENPFTPSGEPPGLYVHVPFCVRKCAYCDFYSVPRTEGIPRWIQDILKEAGMCRGIFPAFDTLYLGGGTPSLIGPEDLRRLFAGLRRELSFLPWVETTLEANPDDLSPGTLSEYRDLGIHRISLGLQSLDEGILGFLGRRHSARAAERSISWSLEAGFQSVGVDLIYGIPGQDPAAWMGCLEKVVSFRPHHLSCYQLTIAEETPFGRLAREGRLAMPDEETLADLFLRTSDMLQAHGYIHYEVSNFALPGHASRHNLKYWRRVPTLGLGPGAHSFAPPVRWWNPASIELYSQKISEGKHPFEAGEQLTAEQAFMERLCLGFRNLEGVDLRTLSRLPRLDSTLEELATKKLITLAHGKIVPTVKGYLVADSLPLRFLE